eukprot:4582474-Pleurochrysis_carterae.AAC.1
MSSRSPWLSALCAARVIELLRVVIERGCAQPVDHLVRLFWEERGEIKDGRRMLSTVLRLGILGLCAWFLY